LRLIINRCWAEHIYFKGKLTLEYLFPAHECRWFIEKNDPFIFEVRDFENNELAEENLAFLEKMFVDKFYPYVYDTKVAPGFIFMWASKFTYESKRWGIHLGWDTYVQTREKLWEVCAPSKQVVLLDLEKARKPWAYQWDVFGTLFFKTKRKKSDLYIGLHGEKTVSSRGIGKPFKVVLSFERNF